MFFLYMFTTLLKFEVSKKMSNLEKNKYVLIEINYFIQQRFIKLQ